LIAPPHQISVSAGLYGRAQELRRTFTCNSDSSEVMRVEPSPPPKTASPTWSPSAAPPSPTPTSSPTGKKGADENEVDQASVYGGDKRGYTDYPALPA